MVAGSDAESCSEIVDYAPDGCLPIQGRPECSDTAHERDSHDEVNIEPVDMLVPVG